MLRNCVLSDVIPPPRAGVPVGSRAHGGGALTDGFTGKAARPWRPAKPPSGLPCPACGMGWPTAEKADACCAPGKEVKCIAPIGSMLTNWQRERIQQMTLKGVPQIEIAQALKLPRTHYNSAFHVYQRVRLAVMAELGLDSDGWKRWQAEKRGER